jgi:hypothetical protein
MQRRDEQLERAAERGNWPVRRHVLGKEPGDSSKHASAAECIAMMWPLALEAWGLAGLPLPDHGRADAPSRLLRGPTE